MAGQSRSGELWEEASGEGFEDVCDALLWSVSRLFRDAVDSGHYSGDYATKHNPTVSGMLPHWAVGVDRLAQEMQAETGWEDAAEREVEMGRRMLIRLETSGNRAILKKLPEMMFQFLYGRECYMSHSTWTVFCKSLVRQACEASARVQKRWKGEELVDEAAVEPEWEGGEGDEAEGAGHLNEPAEAVGMLVAKKREVARVGEYKFLFFDFILF